MPIKQHPAKTVFFVPMAGKTKETLQHKGQLWWHNWDSVKRHSLPDKVRTRTSRTVLGKTRAYCNIFELLTVPRLPAPRGLCSQGSLRVVAPDEALGPPHWVQPQKMYGEMSRTPLVPGALITNNNKKNNFLYRVSGIRDKSWRPKNNGLNLCKAAAKRWWRQGCGYKTRSLGFLPSPLSKEEFTQMEVTITRPGCVYFTTSWSVRAERYLQLSDLWV